MAIGLLFVSFGLRAALIPAQNDSFWQLRAGADIWRTGHVALVDGYSFTAAGLPWPNHEWLWQVLAYGGYRLGGMPAVNLAAAAFILAGIAIAYRLMVGPWGVRFLLLSVGVQLASLWALRPYLVTQCFVVVLAWLLAKERLRVIPLLFLVWANFHGGVALGGLILAAATATAWLRFTRDRAPEDRRLARRRAITLSIVLPLAGLATCATPLGFDIFAFVWESTSRLYALRIREWRPTLPVDFLGVTYWLVAIGLVALVVKRRRALAAAPWADWVIVAAALALLPLAFRSFRNNFPFVMLATVAASRLLGPDFEIRIPWRRVRELAAGHHPRINTAIVTALGVVVAVFVGVAYATEDEQLKWRPVSDGALAAVRACDGPLYNHYGDGGYLIWFAPERPVFVDSRQDPYPLPFLREIVEVERGRAPYRPLFDRWGIRCTFLNVESPTNDVLARDGWVTTFRDDQFVVMSAPDRTR
jgi:hypothetical protein